MNPNQALNILIEAVEIAQKRGAYNLAEVEQIIPAVRIFTKAPVKEEKKEEVKKEEVKKEEVKKEEVKEVKKEKKQGKK